MKCTNCGSEIENGVTVCPSCGAAQTVGLRLPKELARLTSGTKGWLWVLLVIAVFGLFSSFELVSTYKILGAFTILVEIAYLVSVILLLFKRKTIGLYILCVTGVLVFLLNLITGENFFGALLSLIYPFITFCLVRRSVLHPEKIKEENNAVFPDSISNGSGRSGSSIGGWIDFGLGAALEIISLIIILLDKSGDWVTGYYTYRAPLCAHEILMIMLAVSGGFIMLVGILLVLTRKRK